MNFATRSYTGTLYPTPEVEQELVQNFDNWQKLFAVGYEQIATMCGAFLPLGDSQLKVPDNLIEELLGESPSEQQIQNLQNQFDTVIAWVNWFPAEKITPQHNAKYYLPISEATARFREYWAVFPKLNKPSSTILDAIETFNLHKDARIVDRRRAFLDSGMNPNEIEKHFFRGLEYHGAFNSKAQAWRSVISVNFGTAEKSDPAWEKQVLAILEADLKKRKPESQVQTQYLRSLLPRKQDSKGRPPAYLARLNKIHDIQVEEYLEQIQKRCQEIGVAKKAVPDPNGIYAQFFINKLEDLGICNFEGNNSLFYAAYSQPWGQIMSNRSNCVRRILTHAKLYDEQTRNFPIYKTEIELLRTFCEQMSKQLDIEDYQIREHQDNGLEYFFKVAPTKSLEDSIAAVADQLDVKSLKNSNRALLEFLYGKLPLSADRIKAAVKWHYQQEKVLNARLGAVANVLNSPLRPAYGKSKPDGVLNRGTKEVKLTLLTDKGPIKRNIPFKSARAERELFLADNGLPVPRNTKHHNPTNKQATLIADRNELALTVYPHKTARNVNQWAIGITPKLGYNPLPEITKPKILSVDFGWRDAAAYSVLSSPMAIQEKGFLSHTIHSSALNKQIDLFEESGKAHKDLMAFYEAISNEANIYRKKPLDKFANLTFASAIKHTANSLAFILRSTQISDQFLDWVKELVSYVSPHYFNAQATNYSVNQGRLSYERMEMIRANVRLLSTTISIAEKQNIKIDPNFEIARRRLYEKEINLKRERAFVTGRMVLNKAISTNCNYIVVENLEISTDRRKNKWLNVGTARWYVSRIIKFLTDEAPLHGIRVITVNPKLSSHTDVNGQPVCRLMKVNPQTLPDTTAPGKMYSSVASIEKRLATYLTQDKSDTDQIYKNATEAFLKGRTFSAIIQDMKENGDNELFVPWRGGAYAQSAVLGLKHCDVLASHILGQRGFEKVGKSHEKLASGKGKRKTQPPLANTKS